MRKALHVKLTETYKREPLAVISGLPGDDAEMTPGQLRRLADALIRIAADSEDRPLKGKHLREVRREYQIGD